MMKYLLLLASLFLIAGCATQGDVPMTNDAQAWQKYGQTRAEAGFVEYSQQGLAKQSSYLDAMAYKAYQQGYKMGLKTYCSQNASWLGATGQAYRGVCDDVDPFFRQDYMSGVQSKSAGM